MNTHPTRVATRNVHFISGGGGMLVSSVMSENSISVAMVNPPIQIVGKMIFIKNV
jgi:hypothetical protein